MPMKRTTSTAWAMMRLGAAAAITCGALSGAHAQGGASGEGSSAGDADWTHPMTEWGDPDLQGMWPIWHLIGTPMQRPEQYGDRRFMTDEEFAEVQARVEQRNTRYDEEIQSNRMGGGHWAEPTQALRLTSLIVDPPNGRFPALTEAGVAKAATMSGSYYQNDNFDDLTDFDSWDRCITRGLPVSMLPRNYNNGIRIDQAPGYVVISLEMAHESRIIPLDGRPALAPEIRQWLGESRGHWEGNTLVVETTNFNGQTMLANVGVPGAPRNVNPSSESLRIVERFTRVSDDVMEFEMTVEDPVTLTRPFTVQYPMWRDDDYKIFEYACHEGNTAVRNYIETSRYERGLRR